MSRGLTIGFGQVPLTLFGAKGLVTVEGPSSQFSGTGTGTVATPVIVPVTGTYLGSQTVTITCSTPSSAIYYTVDGSTPTFPITGTTVQYLGTFVISANATVKAIAAAVGLVTSSIASVSYVISGGATFDFYISPTGSDTNAGTSVSAPWAITSLMNRSINANNQANFNATSGKRIGFMPGTYNVSTQMQSDSFTGAIQINGSTSSPTYYGSCDSSGGANGGSNYNTGTATTSAIVTALTSGGVFGGTAPSGSRGPILGHGHSAATPIIGNVTVDGITFSGATYKGIRAGCASSGDGPSGVVGVTVQNCVFTANDASAQPGDNVCGVWIDGCIGAVVQNNYSHDNVGTSGTTSMDHLEFCFVWGPSSGTTYTTGTVIQNNTVVNSGGLAWGKVGGIEASTVQANYNDCSMYSVVATMSAIFDFSGCPNTGTANSPLLVGTTVIRNNILLTKDCVGIGRESGTDAAGWVTPCQVFNNTITQAGSVYPAFWLGQLPAGGATGLQIYNNVLVSSGDTSGNKLLVTNPSYPGLIDFNLFPSAMSYALRPNASLGTFPGTTFSSPSAFQTGLVAAGGISGVEANTILAVPSFTGLGTAAQRYQLVAASPGTAGSASPGSVTGATGGAACDRGAWGNLPSGISIIGCSFGP